MIWVRRFARLVLGVLAIALASVSLVTVALHASLGSADRAAATVGAVIDSEHGADVLGAAFVEMLKETAGPDAVITADDEVLAQAAGRAITASKDTILTAVRTAYQANLTGEAATVDLSAVISAIGAELHAVDPGIPATLGDGGDGPGTLNIAANTDPPLAKATRAMGMWWAGLLASALVLAGVGLLAPQSGWRRWRGTGILMTVVGAVWLIAAKTAPGVALAKLEAGVQRDLASEVSSHLVAPLVTVGAVSLVAGVALIFMSTRKPHTAAHAGPAAQTPSQVPAPEDPATRAN